MPVRRLPALPALGESLVQESQRDFEGVRIVRVPAPEDRGSHGEAEQLRQVGIGRLSPCPEKPAKETLSSEIEQGAYGAPPAGSLPRRKGLSFRWKVLPVGLNSAAGSG